MAGESGSLRCGNGTRTFTQNTTFDTGTVTLAGHDIAIEPGVTLTVKGLLNMGIGRKIIVKPHARLIVDGGTLTNRCGEFWKGIEVWGNPTNDQFPLAQPTYQKGRTQKRCDSRTCPECDLHGAKSFPGGVQPSEADTCQRCHFSQQPAFGRVFEIQTQQPESVYPLYLHRGRRLSGQ
ncbi:MAG: hypothetical protein R3C61_00010 [Bacteroidia bacterium]